MGLQLCNEDKYIDKILTAGRETKKLLDVSGQHSEDGSHCMQLIGILEQPTRCICR